MLKLRISIEDTSAPWTWEGHRWTGGRSWIEPYSHPTLEYLRTDNQFCIRERVAGHQRDWLADWPADFIKIEMDAGRIDLTAGAQGVAPLYVTERAGVLHASWDLLDLQPHIDPGALVDREVARLLAFRVRYGHDTLFAHVHRCSERSTATYDRHGLRLHYPEPAVHSSAAARRG